MLIRGINVKRTFIGEYSERGSRSPVEDWVRKQVTLSLDAKFTANDWAP